jgi:protein-S-isoprenylcysteine O-methyltransferase Ste14
VSIPGEIWARWRVRLGYPVGAICFFLARPTWRSIEIGAVIGFFGLLLRGAAAGHLRKGERLATSGPYAHLRNPLYFGSLLLAVGFSAATHSIPATALLTVYFVVFYAAVIQREEKELRVRYGEAFEEYAANVPLLLPRVSAWKNAEERFSWMLYRRNREYEAAVGFAGGIALLWLVMIWRR